MRGALLQGGAAPCLVRRDASKRAAKFVGDAEAVRTAKRGAFTPDQIVYCRTRPLVLPKARKNWAAAVEAYREEHGLDPRVVIVGSEGVFYAASDLAQVKVVQEVYRSAIATILRSPKAGGPRFLTKREAGFIEGWEAEAFRAKVAAGASNRLAGRVAVVTGAGSGLGKGIALGILEAGGTIIGLDVDEAGVRDVAGSQPLRSFSACAL